MSILKKGNRESSFRAQTMPLGFGTPRNPKDFSLYRRLLFKVWKTKERILIFLNL